MHEQPNIESERSFLIRQMPDLSSCASIEIEQHYLDNNPEPLRLRSSGGKFELTRKLNVDPNDMSRKDERNLPLTREQFNLLLPLACRSLTKTRHFVPLEGGLTAEIDAYHGPLEGLLTVEVEFPDEATRDRFTPPDWFGRDISQDEWSANSFLAGKTLADIRHLL